MRLWRGIGCAATALAVALAAGCAGDSDPPESGGPAGQAAPTGPGDDTPTGDTAGGDQAGLPDGWPAHFPDPPAGAVFERVSGPLVQDDRTLYIARYVAEDGDLGELFAYYLQALPAAGWDGRFDADPTNVNVVASTTFSGDEASGELLLDANQGPVQITIHMYLLR